MASRDFPAWLQVMGVKETRLLDPGRISELIKSLTDPTTQRPSCFLFVGQHTRTLALRQIFPKNSFKSRSIDGIATLRVDNMSTTSDNPIFFAESSPEQTISLAAEDPRTCQTESFPIQWAEDIKVKQLHSILHARLFCLFTDVICLFADDFTHFDQVVHLLLTWAAAGSAAVNFIELKPRVVIVRRGDEPSPSPTYDLLKIDELEQDLDRKSLKQFFSSIKVLDLAADQLSPMARFRVLKDCLWKENDEMRLLRERLGCLYSATHLACYFHMAVSHTAMSCTQPFDFILASRQGNEVQPDFIHHISQFLRAGKRHQVSSALSMTFIASAILLDAYPPKIHVFDPKIVFSVHYEALCYKALVEAYNDSELIQDESILIQNLCIPSFTEANSSQTLIVARNYLVNFIQERFIALFSQMIISGKSALQIHRETIEALKINWTLIKTDEICLFCICRMPENPLTCGHAMCDTCVRSVGVENLTFDCQYQIESCPLCSQGRLMVGLKPPTAGLRILSLDGGGVKGKITIAIISQLQDILGDTWRIQDLFDVVYGTSVGGLIALILFIRHKSVSECTNMFDRLAMQLFPRPSRQISVIGRLRHLLKSWCHDGLYDADILEACLKENLGINSRLFSNTRCLISTKVGVTTATINRGDPVLITNYNGLGEISNNYDYKLIRPNRKEPIYTWQAGRATSAAPVIFPSTSLPGFGPVQDGGMSGHNNPLKLARLESLRIEPSLSEIDVAVSIGTGTHQRSPSTMTTSYRHFLLDGFFARLWRAYMANNFDGEKVFNDVINSINKENRDNYIRLNVPLPDKEPSIDDVTRLDELENCVRLDSSIIETCQQTIYALLIASFYFELKECREVPRGGFQCSGLIRCRLPGQTIVELLGKINPWRLAFVMNTRLLGDYNGKYDLCLLCERYQKYIEFSILDKEQRVSILVRSPGRSQRRIGAFPQTIQWFIDRQGLNAPFGNVNHRELHQCKVPLKNLKRRITTTESGPASKEARLS